MKSGRSWGLTLMSRNSCFILTCGIFVRGLSSLLYRLKIRTMEHARNRSVSRETGSVIGLQLQGREANANHDEGLGTYSNTVRALDDRGFSTLAAYPLREARRSSHARLAGGID